jgi:hypothetical protein
MKVEWHKLPSIDQIPTVLIQAGSSKTLHSEIQNIGNSVWNNE